MDCSSWKRTSENTGAITYVERLLALLAALGSLAQRAKVLAPAVL